MINVPIGKGVTAEIQEPNRGDYPNNLGGAFEFSMTHFIFKVLEMAGAAMGAVLAGGLVRFLHTVEPHMVEYVQPLIDGLLDMPDMPGWFHDFLVKLRNPTDEVGTGLLQTFSGTVVSGISGSIMGAIFEPYTQQIRKLTRAGLADPGTIEAMYWRGLMTPQEAHEGLSRQGYTDPFISALHHVMRPRLEMGSMAEGIRRRVYTKAEMYEELDKRGFVDQDKNTAMGLVDNLLDVGSILMSLHRETITDADARLRISDLGYTDASVDIIISNSHVIPGVTDLVTMAVREAWRDDIAQEWGYDEEFSGDFAQWAKKQGLSEEWAKRYWRAHWSLPSVSLGFQMFQRKIIDRGELESLLKTADYPAGWRDNMTAAAYNTITRVDIRRFYRLGLFDRDELVRRYEDVGYSPEDAQHMADFTVAFEDDGGDDSTAQARNITRSLIEAAYRVGKLTREEAIYELDKLNYTDDHIELMLSLVDLKREIDAVPDFLTDYRRDMQTLLLRSYTKRMISAGDLISYLVALGFDAQEADLQKQAADFAYNEDVKDNAIGLIGENYVRRTIDRNKAYELIGGLNIPGGQQDQIFAEWDRSRLLRTRKLTEAQYRKLLQNGVFDAEVYAEHMRGLGYSETDVEYLVMMAT